MDGKPIVVEYLIIIKNDTFCDSDTAFLKFIDVDSRLSISEKDNQLKISLKKSGKLTVSYTLLSDLVPSQKERYFKFTLVNNDVNKIDELNELTIHFESIVSKLDSEVSINLLWNDVSRIYAIEGYSLINEVENLLRRLIGSFMLTNVGYDYPKYHIPTEVENRERHLKINYSDYLHQTYFSDLKTILFEGQREFKYRNIGDIQKIVEKHISEKKNHILIDDLKGVIAKSLWEKYFAKDTNYQKKELEDDLEKLNSLRNEIAHNRHVSRETLGKIQSISKRIIKTLKLEIADLPNKKLTVEEQNFQVFTENVRIAETNYAMRGYLAEKAVANWYTIFYEGTVELVDGYKHDKVVDILVILNDKKIIGVGVKNVSLKRINEVKHKISSTLKADLFFQKNLSDFYEFHFVIVLADYVEKFEFKALDELNNIISEISPNVKLIVGYITENKNFLPIINLNQVD
jgi:hypothetical protein